MDNNYILRKLRYALDYNDFQMIELFELGGVQIDRKTLCNMLKKDDDTNFVECNDALIAKFLDGLITQRRGEKDPQKSGIKRYETKLTNNTILRKLKIAFELTDKEMINVYKKANFTMSKPQLSALFRRKGHRNYDECSDQYLRTFIKGLTATLRPNH